MYVLAVFENLFLLAALLYIFYLISFLKLLFFKKNTSYNNSQTFISVLICAKNEAKNLQNNLAFILDQDYPNFEVIVVNDKSTDHTEAVLRQFQQNNSKLRCFSSTGNSSKKTALQLAKTNAQGNIFVLTDADCYIPSANWLKLITQPINDTEQVVLGYAPNFKKNTFLNALQNYETLTTALQYLSAALYNSPYMAVGRNLAYTKTISQEINLSNKQNKLLSGDDDLWLQHAVKKSKIKIQIKPDSFAYSHAEDSLLKWWNQKRRHITTANYYRLKDKIILASIFITKFYFWAFTVGMLFFTTSTNSKIALLCVLTCMLLIYNKASTKFKSGNLWLISPILDFSLICFQISLFISNLVSPIKKWK